MADEQNNLTDSELRDASAPSNFGDTAIRALESSGAENWRIERARRAQSSAADAPAQPLTGKCPFCDADGVKLYTIQIGVSCVECLKKSQPVARYGLRISDSGSARLLDLGACKQCDFASDLNRAISHANKESHEIDTFPAPAPAEMTVENALAELREMFPTGGIQIRHDIWYSYNKPDVRHDDFTVFADGIPLHPVKAKTLTKAMTAVRKWKEQQ